MKQQLVKVGMCALNNDPLHFKKNYEHIHESIRRCKEQGCTMRFGAQLEVSGYPCNDHFNEYDTVLHSWDVIGDILKSKVTEGIVCFIGTPIEFSTTLYNTQIIICDNKIFGIRPKMALADGGNYFETRWFGHWKAKKQISQFKLPEKIQEICRQKTVPFGEFLLDFNDTTVALQICEEAWRPFSPMVDSALDGAQIFINPSGSHVERNKMIRKLQLVQEITSKCGGSYCYINIKGGVGERTYFDGGNIFCENGQIKDVAELQTLEDVVVTPVVCNLNRIKTFRMTNKSFSKQTFGKKQLPRVKIEMNAASYNGTYAPQSPKHKAQLQRKMKIYRCPHATYQPSLFLWDYLRKSKAGGFFLALSGGLDSCSVALTVYNMCIVVARQILQNKREKVLKDLRNIVDDQQFMPKNAQQIVGRILFTCYMGTNNSSEETRNRSSLIAKTINSNHRSINFQKIYESFKELADKTLGLDLKYKNSGGNWRSDIALQNIQARARMLLSYLFAQTELEIPKRRGFLLVLGSSNLDESLRGYFTKYDCSAADFNPIGSFSKLRLKQYLNWNLQMYKFDFINQILNATPTAELQPLNEGEIAQTDEEDMGLSYSELGLFGRLRNIQKLGPVLMFDRIHNSEIEFTPQNLAQKIKRFFKFYTINRHKMNILTPSFHYDPEGCDDNRFDMRPIIYETDWTYQFELLDQKVKQAKKAMKQ